MTFLHKPAASTAFPLLRIWPAGLEFDNSQWSSRSEVQTGSKPSEQHYQKRLSLKDAINCSPHAFILSNIVFSHTLEDWLSEACMPSCFCAHAGWHSMGFMFMILSYNSDATADVLHILDCFPAVQLKKIFWRSCVNWEVYSENKHVKWFLPPLKEALGSEMTAWKSSHLCISPLGPTWYQCLLSMHQSGEINVVFSPRVAPPKGLLVCCWKASALWSINASPEANLNHSSSETCHSHQHSCLGFSAFSSLCNHFCLSSGSPLDASEVSSSPPAPAVAFASISIPVRGVHPSVCCFPLISLERLAGCCCCFWAVKEVENGQRYNFLLFFFLQQNFSFWSFFWLFMQLMLLSCTIMREGLNMLG